MAIAHKGFILQSSLFSTSRLLCALLSVSRAFLIARWLGPTIVGTWQFIQIFERYSSYASLGTRSAMSRKVPYLRGKDCIGKSASVLNNAFVANFIGAVIYSATVFAYSFLLEESREANALASYSLVILLSSWFGFNSVVFMSLSLYSDINRIEVAEAVISTLSIIALSYFFGIYGIIFGFFLSRLIAFCLSTHQLWDHFKFEVDWKVLFELIRTGIPMMIISILVTTMAVVDRILIATMLSREMLGIYGVANVGIYVIRTASTSIGQLFLVKFSEMHGQNKSVKNTAEALDKSMVALSAFLAPLVAGVIAVFPMLVWLLLPRFTAGIGAGKLLIAEVYFLALSLPPANWCVATERYVSVILVRGGLVAAEIIGIWLLLRYEGGLEKVAGCVLAISAICCLSMIIIVNRGLKRRVTESIIQSGYVLAPFAAIMIGIGIQHGVYERLRLDEGARLGLSCALGGLVSLAICLPFVLRASRILGICQLMRDTFEG